MEKFPGNVFFLYLPFLIVVIMCPLLQLIARNPYWGGEQMNTGRIIVSALAASILAIPAMADAPGYFQVPGTETTLKLYGQIQLREAYGLNGNGMGDVSGIPAALGTKDESFQQRGQWSGSWRYYMGVTTTTPSSFGDVTTTIYGRFNHTDSVGVGQAVNFNLERAFVQIGGLKVGTDWSMFGDNAWEPNTLFGCVSDEDGSWENVRQIAYKFSPAKGWDLGVALESSNNGSTSAGTSNGTNPGVSAVVAFSQDWGGVTLAANYQQKKDWLKTGPTQSGNGTSLFLSGGFNITPKDQLTAMILKGGEGYGSGQDGFYTENASSYGFYKSTAMNVSYTHTWNDQFSSALTVGQIKWPKDTVAQASLVPVQVAGDYKVTEFIVNTTWNITKTVSFGLEYQHAQNKASNVAASPWVNDGGSAKDSNTLDMFRMKLKATLW